MSLPLSKLPSGVLNNRIREKIYQGVDVNKDNFMKILRRVVGAQFGEHYTIVNREFTGICIQVLTDQEKQSLVTSGHFDKVVDTSASNLEKKTACRVFIPEIHADRALPDDIYSPSDKDKLKMQAFFPIFVSETEEVASKPLQLGQLLQVKIKNNNGGGSFLYFLNDTNSRVNIFNQNKPANDLFRCEIFRLSRIVNSQGRSISLGQVVTSEKEQSNNKLTEANLKQQYKKYLSEKETYWYKKLKDYWTRPKLKRLIEEVIVPENISVSGDTAIQDIRKLMWLLLQKFSAYSITGVTNAGLTVLNVDSIDDSYGIFKTTKEQFDSYVLAYNSNTIARANLLNEYKQYLDSIFVTEGFQHADLLDPFASMSFFIVDFILYLEENDKTLPGVASDLNNSKNQKLITNYFTKNDKRIEFIFSSNFTAVLNQYNTINSSAIVQAPNVKTGTGDTPAFPEFQAWLTAAAGGAAVDISSFKKVETEKPNNSQVLDVENPKDTKDECHSNYPQRSSYLEHVDAQKALMRKYIESNISGEDLNFLANTHRGVNNIVMSDRIISTPFKTIRYDGTTGYGLDNNRWFNANNNSNLVEINLSNSKYYRPKQLITKVTITTLNLKNDSSGFYKNNLKLMYNLNKPLPHFLITPEGQIIQLVDAAAVVETGLANKRSSITIAFTEGIGTIGNINGENNTVLDNYILVSPSVTFNNVYRPHKIGSKAALQAADKLIKFLISKTRIKYNVAAQDFKLTRENINKSGVQAYGHYKGVAGMNFIYYAWTYGLAYKNNAKNIERTEVQFN